MQNVPTFQDFSLGKEKLTDSKALLLLIIFSGLSFLLTLFLPSIGEEGVYTNITLEMLYNNEYLAPTLYGVDYYRPPLFNWTILGFTKIFGPTKVVIAARLVNMLATLSTAGILVWFARRTFPEKQFALLCGAIYLSGDLLFKRGWLAYADSLFALFVFSSIVCLWLALENQQRRWLFAASLSLCCGFLTKVHTIYLFYALSGLVLLFKHKNRQYMFSPISWITHSVALTFPFIWNLYIKDGNKDFNAALNYSQALYQWPGLFAYLSHIFITYPLNLIFRFLPTSIIACVMWYKLRSQKKPAAKHNNITIVLWIVILNLLPYWLSPSSTVRYILPLYPLIALLIAYTLWQAGNETRSLAVKFLIATLVLKYLVAAFWLPYEHNVYRGNAMSVAKDILAITKEQKLYINDPGSAGLRVATALNQLRVNKAPVGFAPIKFSGYILNHELDSRLGDLVKEYNMRNIKLYLLFKTSAD